VTEIKIIDETDDLLVLDKPAGLIVHSDGRTREPSVADWLLEQYPALAVVGEPWISPQGESIVLPGIVHRLDRMTSGVMLIAKTADMYAYLKQEFRARRVEKIYLAYAYGHMESEEGRIVAEIARSSEAPRRRLALRPHLDFLKQEYPLRKSRRWYARPCEESDKRAAITEWKLLKNLEADAAYLEVRPRTGRTHQIRVHLASIGHPVIGDPLYSCDRASSEELLGPAGRMYLHAYNISLTFPDGRHATFAAPLPPDFQKS
jgi:23S rRNA pseudouridine1911/1915/1917 synthase